MRRSASTIVDKSALTAAYQAGFNAAQSPLITEDNCPYDHDVEMLRRQWRFGFFLARKRGLAVTIPGEAKR